MGVHSRATVTLGKLFRRAFGRRPRGQSAPPNLRDGDSEKPIAGQHDEAAAWLAALDAGLLCPPQNVRDAEGWDTYWKHHLEVGVREQDFSDMMSSDEGLPGLLTRRGSQTILCAGNGLSHEALALALLGFHVTALDISVVPADVIGQSFQNPQHPVHRIPGSVIGDNGSVSFAGSGPIDPDLCPPMHRSADHTPRGGGALSFVTADLTDPEVCTGPFDVVIERRTVQLFPPHERLSACGRLVARLAERGVLVSHEHQGGWRPGEARTHFARAWLASKGFAVLSRAADDRHDSAERLAYLVFSSG
jgi:hypothetical protein